MQASHDDERDQIISIFEGLSPEAKLLLIDVIKIENEHLNLKQPTGLADKIVRRAEGIIK